MQKSGPATSDQTQMAVRVLSHFLGEDLLAVYRHGSAVLGGCRPLSDIDLLVIVGRGITDNQWRNLITALLPISARHPIMPGGPRCIELITFRQSELLRAHFPVCAECPYGEWLREGFEEGQLSTPSCDPEYTLLFAQARQHATCLFGRDILKTLPHLSPEHIRQTMRDAHPALLTGLRGDERNVLLTLARM